MEFLIDLKDFAWAVLNNWAGYATGGIVVAILTLWSTLKQKSIPRRPGIVVAIIFLVFAFFTAWREQHRNAVKWQTEVQNETKSNFDIQLLTFATGGVPVQGKSVAQAIIGARISNTGAPAAAVAESWKFTVKTEDGDAYQGIPTFIDPDQGNCITYTGSETGNAGKMLLILREDALDLKASQVIERNGYKEGMLIFHFRELTEDQLSKPDNVFTMTVQDSLGTTFQNSWKPSELPHKFGLIESMKYPFFLSPKDCAEKARMQRSP